MDNIHSSLQSLAYPIDKLNYLDKNARRGNIDSIKESYKQFGQRKPIVATADGTVIAGNHQLQSARQLGWDKIAVVFTDDDELTAKAFALADNRTSDLGTYDNDFLVEMLTEVESSPEMLQATGFTEKDIIELVEGGIGEKGKLALEFGAPPFSVLDTKQAYWQDRKKQWLSFGIQSEIGRQEDLTYNVTKKYMDNRGAGSQTSVFDPVLTELIYKWFTKKELRIYKISRE